MRAVSTLPYRVSNNQNHLCLKERVEVVKVSDATANVCDNNPCDPLDVAETRQIL